MIYFYVNWIIKKMSKAKKRSLHRNKSTMPLNCSRQEAIKTIFSAIKNKKFDKNIQDIISLFGISGEELSEAGLNWEELKAISSHLQ